MLNTSPNTVNPLIFTCWVSDRTAGINMIESAYKLAPLNANSWRTLQKACQIFFIRNVVPNFINLESLPEEDRAVLLTGKNSNVSHLFKVAQCLKINSAEASRSTVQCKKEEMCPLQNQVKQMIVETTTLLFLVQYN